MLAAMLAAPHVGLRTVPSLSMWSNLRTEVAPNHMFIPTLRLFPYNEDLVRVFASPGGSTTSYLVPWLEFRHQVQLRLANGERFAIRFAHRGKQHTFDTTLAAFPAGLEMPRAWWERKLLAHRRLQDPSEVRKCEW
jgi:hypothetical protein